MPSHEKFITLLQEAHSLPFPRVAPNSYQHTVSTVIHLAQSSPTPLRSFLERVQEPNCELINCSRQLHHNPSPRSHVNCFIFHTPLFHPQSSILTTPQPFQLQSLQKLLLRHLHSHSTTFQNILPAISRNACPSSTIRPESSRSATAARQTRHP